jgi:hypothetical protein
MKRFVFLLLLINISLVANAQEGVLLKRLKIKYDTISELTDLKTSNLFSFKTKNKVGLVNVTGSIVYEPYFESISVYEANYNTYIKGKMPNGNTALLDTEGQVQFQPYYEDLFLVEGDLLLTKHKGKYGMVNMNGTGYLHPEFDTVKVMIDEDTLFLASMQEKNMVFNTNSEVIEYFDGDTVVSFIETDNLSLFPFAWILEPEYDVVKYIGGGNFYCRKDKETKIVNRKAIEIENKKLSLDPKYLVTFDWSRIIYRDNALVGMLDYDGRIIVEPQYEDMSIIIEDELYSYKQEGKWGLINRDGKIYNRNQFIALSAVTYNNTKYIKAITSNNKTALLNRRGRVIFQGFYEDIEPANKEGFYNQIENGAKGIITKEGLMYVYPEYDEVRVYLEADTFFVARRNNRYTLFGTIGNKIYDGFNSIIDITDSSILYLEENVLKRGIIRNNKLMPNAQIININYKEFREVFDSIIIVKDSKGMLYANRKTLKPINDIRYNYITPMTKGYAFVVEGKELKIIDKDFNKVFTIIDTDLVQSELEQMANLLYYAHKEGFSYQYIRKNDKYGVFRLKPIREVKIKK